MKLTDLVIGQVVIIQFAWGDQKIEFSSSVIDKTEEGIITSPYIHNGSELKLNVKLGQNVVCTVFANNPINKQRISWRNVELATEENDTGCSYLIKTSGFNITAKHDDRRKHDRSIINRPGHVLDVETGENIDVVIHDISDIGISFYAPLGFNASTHQLTIRFEDSIDDKSFSVKVDCIVTRTNKEEQKIFHGCRIVGENKDYLLYGFLLRLNAKSKLKREVADTNS